LAGLAIAAAAALFGVQELYALATADAALILIAASWVHTRRWRLAATRKVQPLRVPAGAEARVHLAITATGSRPSPVLTACDPFDGGPLAAELLLAPVAPGETVRAAYRLPAPRRGRYVIGPLRLELSDPFGVTRWGCSAAGCSVLLVHPPMVDLVAPLTQAGSDRREAVGAAVVGAGGDEFFGIREYRDGDDLRRVHWSSTAKTDELMIRQDEISWSGRLTVAADLRDLSHIGESLETVLSVAASVAASATRSHLHVRYVSTSGADTGFGSSGAHLCTILDELAVSEAHPPDDGVSLLRLIDRVGPGGATVVVTTTATSAEELNGMARVLGGADTTVVIVERAPGLDLVRRGLRVQGARVIRLTRLAAFALAWEEALGRTALSPGRR